MADEKHPSHSLREQSADQIRNEQRGGTSSPPDPERSSGPEANATMRRAWSQPGGEAQSYRSAKVGAGGDAEDHAELTAAETPDATKHLSDATPSKDDSDAAQKRRPAETTHTLRDPGGIASDLQPGGTLPGGGPGASVGSIGTGGGSTADAPTGSVKRRI